MCLRQCHSHYSISGKLEKTFSGSGKTDESAKKELEKLSKTMTDKIDKVTLSIRQDIKKFCFQVSETTKNLTEKLNGQEKSVTEKISGCQKTLTDKISAQEKSVKDVIDKIGENAMKRNHYKSASLLLTTLFKHLFAVQRSLTAVQKQIRPPLLSWSL